MCLENLSFFSSCIFWFDERSQLSWSATPRCEAACLGAMPKVFATSFATSFGWLQLCVWGKNFGASQQVKGEVLYKEVLRALELPRWEFLPFCSSCRT